MCVSLCVCICMCVCKHGCIGLHCVFYVHVYLCVSACLCVHACVLEHIHQSPYLKPVVPALFDACSTVTKPYCTHTTVLHKSQHDREKRHCFSLTSDTFSLRLLAHKMLSSFVPCLRIIFVQWTKSRYFVIFKEIYRYIYV